MDTPAQPKRRNRTKTKARILAAAQEAFSQTGYSQAGIRAVAERAGVSFPMLMHYFGSKAGLYEAALIDATDATALYDVPKDGFGAFLMRQISNLEHDIKAPALIALATGDAEARTVATRVMEEHGIARMAEWLGPPDARLRAIEISMLAIAFVLFTRQFPLVSPGSAEEARMIEWMSATIQQIVDRT